MILAGIIAAVWFARDGIKIDLPQVAPYLAFVVAIGAAGEYCRRSPGLHRLAMPLDGLAVLGACAIIFPALQLPAARLDLPLIDPELVAADRWLGFDWMSHFHWVAHHPLILGAFEMAYLSFGLQSSCLAFAIGLMAPRRLQCCLLANLLALAVCFAAFSLIPAAGAAGYLGIDTAPWPYVGQFFAARAGAITTLVPSEVRGIIQFPSYHAAMAVIFAYGFARLAPRLAWALIALNALMTLSALAIGAHHLIDILAGLMLGFFAVGAVRIFSGPKEAMLPRMTVSK